MRGREEGKGDKENREKSFVWGKEDWDRESEGILYPFCVLRFKVFGNVAAFGFENSISI